jgi:pyridoxamine 5'-phosphate oxidase
MSEINEHIRKLRSDYSQRELIEKHVAKDPILQFENWMQEAISAEVPEPHAMTLSTAAQEGKLSSRIVLLRYVSTKGFVFYTNYNSNKGKDIVKNPNAALNFFWQQIERQIRVEGTLEKVSDAVSDAYFQSRPRESKIGAWVSNQSTVIKNREMLEEKFIELSAKYPGEEVPRPPYWGGYLLKPSLIEFWQGRPSRLHDRIQYVLENGNWSIQRLAP